MEKQDIELVLDLQGSLLPIYGEVSLLEQMFNGLISNALESMPNGGRLRVTAQKAQGEGHVELNLTDNGLGIAKKQLNDVFKPFFTSKRSGLGLGLPLVMRIVERHGGEITLSSKEGQGTSVSLRFPTVSR